MAEESGGREQGRSRLGWMYGVKMALRNRGMTVLLQKEWSALLHMQLNEFNAGIFAWPSVLSDSPSVLWWLSPGDGWDAVT